MKLGEYKLGRLVGLNLSAVPSAFIGSIVVWIALSALAVILLRWTLDQALAAGLIATATHWLGETLHQVGHAWFARRTGYPMLGIRYWGMLSASVYPRDEPALPAAIHMQRALGGPVASLMVAVAAGLIFFALNAIAVSSVAGWLALYSFFENLLVFGLGSLLPLGFTDGSTLLRWWRKK